MEEGMRVKMRTGNVTNLTESVALYILFFVSRHDVFYFRDRLSMNMNSLRIVDG